jgi:hypothetical protein
LSCSNPRLLEIFLGDFDHIVIFGIRVRNVLVIGSSNVSSILLLLLDIKERLDNPDGSGKSSSFFLDNQI